MIIFGKTLHDSNKIATLRTFVSPSIGFQTRYENLRKKVHIQSDYMT